MRGPGETQLETDRRLLAVRLKQIQQRLDKVDRQRHQGRSQRKKVKHQQFHSLGIPTLGNRRFLIH